MISAAFGSRTRAGRSISTTMLTETYTDGFLVIHDGGVITERYLERDGAVRHAPADVGLEVLQLDAVRRPRRPGRAHPRRPRHRSPRRARGSAWEGCTVQHLLDMRVGARWDYDVDEYTILDVSDYRTHERTDIPADTATWIRTVDATPCARRAVRLQLARQRRPRLGARARGRQALSRAVLPAHLVGARSRARRRDHARPQRLRDRRGRVLRHAAGPGAVRPHVPPGRRDRRTPGLSRPSGSHGAGCATRS